MFGLRKVPMERLVAFTRKSPTIKQPCKVANTMNSNINIFNSRFVSITLYKTKKNVNKYKSVIKANEFFNGTWALNIENRLPTIITAIGIIRGICNLPLIKK
jgi:hypothetical protein